jgi:hypothetical protein
VIRVLTSRIGLVLGTLAISVTLHFAGRTYVAEWTEDSITLEEVGSLKAENTRLLKLTAVTQKLNRDLEAKQTEADRSLAVLEKDIQAYEAETAIGTACAVTARILKHLRQP